MILALTLTYVAMPSSKSATSSLLLQMAIFILQRRETKSTNKIRTRQIDMVGQRRCSIVESIGKLAMATNKRREMVVFKKAYIRKKWLPLISQSLQIKLLNNNLPLEKLFNLLLPQGL